MEPETNQENVPTIKPDVAHAIWQFLHRVTLNTAEMPAMTASLEAIKQFLPKQ